jgi:DNA (cytosine-5)-methyltransferase 1
MEQGFTFPEPFPLEKKLKDILDTDVDEKYYITKTDNLVVGSSRVQWDNSGKGYGSTNTLTSVQKDNYVAIKTANKQGYDLATDGDGIDLAYPNSATRRGRVGHEVSKTLACSDTMGTYQNYRIRKLTPKECWRLMGFDDSDFEKAEKVNSNSQLYKQAGNSIIVNVLEGILRNLLCKTTK